MIKNLFFSLFLFLELAFAQGFRESLTDKERAWLDAHPVIKHTGNPVYLPYEAFNEKGRHLGMVADYLNIIEKMLGIKIERVVSSSWEDVLYKSREKQVDIITNYTNDDDFGSSHLITKGFIKSPIVVVKQIHNYYQHFISDLSELKGEKIAVGRRYAFLSPILKEYPLLNYIEVDTIENVLKGVSSGEFDAAIVSLNIGTYNISKHGLRNLQVLGKYDFELELGFQVAKENETLLHILNKVLDALSQEQHQKILNRWTVVEIKKEFDYRYIAALLFIIALGTLLYFFRSYELKREIAKSTSELSRLLKVFDEHVIALEIDLNGNITYASEAFCIINGYSQKELLGKSYHIIKHLDNDQKIYKELWDTITEGKVWRGVLKNRKKNGGYYWVEAVITQEYDSSSKISGYMAILHDVTAEIELKEFSANLEEIVQSRTEELLALNKQQKAIFDSAGIGIMLLKERMIRQVNNQACEMFGYSEHELINSTTRILCENDASYEKISEYYKIIDAGKIAVWEQKIVRKDGSTFVAKIRIKAKDEKNLSAGVVAAIDDVTLEHKALEDIKKAKEIAEEATRSKSQFLANMSHEIRTPMSAIIGMAYLALETDLDKKQRGYVQKIENAAKNLLGIINDVLDFSKIEAKKMTLEHKKFYLEDIFENLIDIFVFKMEEKKLKLLFNISKDVPSALIGDSLKLSQILINLLSNAIKFTDKGKIIISVKVIEAQNGIVKLGFEVIDSGIGLSHEQIEKLFNPFHQADGSITRTYGGTGLGLSISKHFVEMMDGEIGVESEPGKGSTFYFSVKLELEAKDKTIFKENTPKKFLTPSNLHDAVLNAFGKKIVKYSNYEKIAESVGGAKVLVVEDNLQNQEIAIELLNKVGVEVDVAGNGKEALAKIKESEYDGIFMDCQMPVMDGYEATIAIRREELFKEIPIIAMTANSTLSDKEHCRVAGMSDYITKPIDVKNFYQLLIKWIKPKNPTYGLAQDTKNSMKIELEKLKIYGVDIDKALIRVAKDEKILFNMLKRFSNSQKESVQKISQALKNEKMQDAQREIHTLRGLCGNIEAASLAKELQKLEDELSLKNLNIDLIDSKISEIDKELKKVIASIDDNLKVFDEISKTKDKKMVTGIDLKEIQVEFSTLSNFFKNFDSEAIESAQNLAQKLMDFMPKEDIELMLKASSNFDFTEADKYLKKLARELNLDNF